MRNIPFDPPLDGINMTVYITLYFESHFRRVWSMKSTQSKDLHNEQKMYLIRTRQYSTAIPSKKKKKKCTQWKPPWIREYSSIQCKIPGLTALNSVPAWIQSSISTQSITPCQGKPQGQSKREIQPMFYSDLWRHFRANTLTHFIINKHQTFRSSYLSPRGLT